jgi:hypothetical protein
MSASPASSNPAATAFITLVLGRSANAIELLVPPAAPVHAATDLKARCFDFLADLLLEHSLLYSSAELIAAFGHIPSSSYNAALESTEGCRAIRSAFFLVENLIPLGFRDSSGTLITKDITADPTTRPSSISFFAFRTTVDPSLVDPRLDLPSFSFEFWLALPQTLPTTSSPTTINPIAQQLDFATPAAPSTAASKVTTAAELNALDTAELQALGTDTSVDVLSDYEPACFSLFTAAQIRVMVLRSAAAAATTLSGAPPSLSPRMQSVLTPSLRSGASYFGSLDFLDSQSAFDLLFPYPVPLLVTPSSSSVSIDSTSLLVDLNSFLDRCKFRLFVPIFRYDYVGSSDRNDAASLHATIQALKKLSMSSRNTASGHWVNLTPDELYAA